MSYMISECGLFTENSDIVSDCLWTLSYMADTNDDVVIDSIAQSDLLAKLCEWLGDREFTIFVPALRAIGNILTTNDHRII